MSSVNISHIAESLSKARSEENIRDSKHFYELALSYCEEIETIETSETDIQIYILKATILGELALEEDLVENRQKQWKKSFAVLDSIPLFENNPNPDIAIAYALLAVDCFQDLFSNLGKKEKLRILRTAKTHLDSCLNRKGLDENISNKKQCELLIRKSSVLRHIALKEEIEDTQLNRLHESVRCAEKAVSLSKHSTSMLNLALSKWAYFRRDFVKNKNLGDYEYNKRLEEIEKLFVDDLLNNDELCQLTTSRFYRMTQQPFKACQVFPFSTVGSKNYRRLLRESYIYAEAAIRLWWQKFPDDDVQKHLSQAQKLLETAISAGYCNARILVNLAYIKAITDKSIDESDIFYQIFGSNHNWEDTLKILNSQSQSSLTQGFLLGINQSSTWTLLGTIIWEFLKDTELAEKLYRGAISLNKKDCIALTNLARLLVRERDASELPEATSLIASASNFSDRRFYYWREIRDEIREKKMDLGKKPFPKKMNILTFSDETVKINDISKYFSEVEKNPDPHKRGFELEKLLNYITKTSLNFSAESYRIQEFDGSDIQIDGYFEFETEGYRVECKWHKKEIQGAHIRDFIGKLDASCIWGLFISMSGFTPDAISAAIKKRSDHRILLMDGEEARLIFHGYKSFDEVMTIKKRYYNKETEVYHKVSSNT
jgi:hypothetical protein